MENGPSAGFRLGGRPIEPELNEIDGTRVDAKAMDVLVALVAAAPQVLAAADLLERVWPKVVVGDNVVHQAIAHLRAALGDRAREPRFIEHVPRRGYRLLARIERGAAAVVNVDGTTTARPPASAPGNLPIVLTTFVGRGAELDQVHGLLEAQRLVTITGVGGAGKTRFALELAGRAAAAFADGVWLLELAPIADPALIMQVIATTLHLHERAGQPISDTVHAALAAQRMLLVFDNCEHLIDACARVIESLLQHAPGLKVLATSRELLGIGGEYCWRIAPLALPDPAALPPLAALAEIESVRLLIERARETQPSFALTAQNAAPVAHICARLDGIPLAIELAAARLAVLTPAQICSRLDDRFRLLTGGYRTALPRQQTLQATLDWSYALLEAWEQTLARRLAVFAGGWTLEAAEAVAGGEPLQPASIVELLTRLVDKSWVQLTGGSGGAPRYRLLETVRQYSIERLLDAGEGDELRGRHRDYFAGLAERAARGLRTSDQPAAVAVLDAEQDNLRAAMVWCAHADAAAGLTLASALWRYWMIRGQATPGRRTLAEVLAQAPESARTAAARANALLGAGWLARFQGDHAAATRQLNESLALFAALADRAGEAEASCNLASNLVYVGEAGAGERLAERALELARLAGDPYVTSYCLQTFGDLLAGGGNFGRARALLDEGVALLRTLGHEPNLAFALAKLGYLLLQHGELRPARIALEEARALHERIGDGFGIEHTLLRLGWLTHHEGDDVVAGALLERSLANSELAGFAPEAALALSMLGQLAVTRGEFEFAETLLMQGLTYAREVKAHDASANCLEGLAMLARQRGKTGLAAQLLGAADRIREGAHRPLPPIELPGRRRFVRALRQALGKAEFDAALTRGAELSLEDLMRRTAAADEKQ